MTALLLTLVLALAACGGAAPAPETTAATRSAAGATAQTTTKAVTEATNTASTTEAAGSDPSSQTQGSTEPEAKAPVPVEITIDNWQEYFEIVAVESPAYYYLSGIGVFLDTTRFFEYELRLRDAYAEQYRAHGSYGYPKGTGFSVDTVTMIAATGDAWIDEEIAVSFTYTVKADAQFINRILYIYTEDMEGEAEITGEGSLKKDAFLRYLMAQDNSFEEDQNEYFLHVFAPLPKTFTVVAKDEDLSRYGWTEELSEAFVNEIMEITITDISGTIPVWEEE